MSITSDQRSKINTANVAKGKATERRAARYLSDALGLEGEHAIIRFVRTGNRQTSDPGDLAVPGHVGEMVISVKDTDRIKYLNRWFVELEAMAGPDTAVRFVVHRWPQHSEEDWHVYVRAGVFASVMMAAGFGNGTGGPMAVAVWARRVLDLSQPEPTRTPIMVRLGPWARMLRAAGFGQAELTTDEAVAAMEDAREAWVRPAQALRAAGFEVIEERS
jgi:hypothetical protein